MSLSIAGIVALVVFYLLVLVTGVLANWCYGRRHPGESLVETSLVAGRSLKGAVGVLTMIATTVGGGYINGTAESVATSGLVWTLAPFGIFLGLNIGGAVYARRMRDQKYITMLDPIQSVFGVVPTILVYVATLLGDLLWTAAILSALGSSLHVIAEIPLVYAVIVSSLVTVAYTLVGNMLAVAYTDVLQLFFIALGLFMSIPFILQDSRVPRIDEEPAQWMGELSTDTVVTWIDLLLAMSLGSIPWQAYFQRVLSVQTSTQAVVLSVVGAFGALLFAIPSIIIGAVATRANWTDTEYGRSPLLLNSSDAIMVLPLVLKEFTPPAVYPIALGAISAAVMSSMDSAILGSSAMFTHNIYHKLIRKEASDRHLMVVQRVTVLCVGAVATTISLCVGLIYPIFILAADIVYVIVLPQLTYAIFLGQRGRGLGAIMGFIVGALLRFSAGEPSIGLPCAFSFHSLDCREMYEQFPFRTFAMVVSGLMIVAVSEVSNYASRWILLYKERDAVVTGVNRPFTNCVNFKALVCFKQAEKENRGDEPEDNCIQADGINEEIAADSDESTPAKGEALLKPCQISKCFEEAGRDCSLGCQQEMSLLINGHAL